MIPPHPETTTAISTSPRPNPTILRPGRNASYGDSIHERHDSTIRIFFQNVKGLTYSATGEDYGYYLSCVSSLGADIIVMAETNSAWEHSHIRTTFHATARKQFQSHKVHFSSPSKDIDPMPDTESFQSGGALTLATNTLVSMALGDPSKDISGLGRWSTISFRGQEDRKFTVFTAYRVCKGHIQPSHIGSAYSRKYTRHKQQGISLP